MCVAPPRDGVERQVNAGGDIVHSRGRQAQQQAEERSQRWIECREKRPLGPWQAMRKQLDHRFAFGQHMKIAERRDIAAKVGVEGSPVRFETKRLWLADGNEFFVDRD